MQTWNAIFGTLRIDGKSIPIGAKDDSGKTWLWTVMPAVEGYRSSTSSAYAYWVVEIVFDPDCPVVSNVDVEVLYYAFSALLISDREGNAMEDAQLERCAGVSIPRVN